MKAPLLAVLAAAALLTLPGCISVHREVPETTTTRTTRHTTIDAPATTTVERTTVY